MAPATQSVIALIGLATLVLAATIALRQNDIKKVLAYSTVSQLGYMFLGLGVGAYTGAVFHVMTHAFFKALLFLGAGSVIHAMGGEQDMRQMGGLRKHMPVTHFTFLFGCLAIAGMPPFSGFFSKDEILAAAYAANPVLWGIGFAGALMTAFYMFRLYAMTFSGTFRGTSEQRHHLHESPLAMTLPLMVLAFLSLAGGWIGIPELFVKGGHRLEHFLAPVFADGKALAAQHSHLSHSTEYALMGVAVAGALIALLVALRQYGNYKKSEAPSGAFGRLLENKWYVDELYQAIIIRPLEIIAGFFNNVLDRKIIDGLVNGIGKVVVFGSRQLRLLQSGQVGSYVLLMVLGMLLLFVLQFFIKK
jgi:NADH-quinone oxidoreductase subunit L